MELPGKDTRLQVRPNIEMNEYQDILGEYVDPRSVIIQKVKRMMDIAAKTNSEASEMEAALSATFSEAIAFQHLDNVEAELEVEKQCTQREKRRLKFLEDAIFNIPDLMITYREDGDEEDSIGMIPQGWNFRIDAVCTEPVTVNAPTFIEMIDKAMLVFDEDER